MMDAGFAHGLWTAFLIVVFVAIVAWAWSGRRKRDFAEAARLPLEEDAPVDGSPAGAGSVMLKKRIEELGLDVETVLSAHGRKAVTWSEFEAAVAAYDDDPCIGARAICR